VKRCPSPLPQVTTAPPAGQNPTDCFCCKACGKIFHYMYTLRTHTLSMTGRGGKLLRSLCPLPVSPG
uniref:C2H2-type domain-containing protein n=1 Tax=Acanthochromis polyacanthus TaxID=80966 RepID=A0A3Q1EYC2_9TELE